MSSKHVVLTVADWDTSAIKYMAPKVNDKGGKSISLVSKQTNRSLHITTPLLMTWGIADFVDEKGESDGKYSISLNFPNDEYRTPATDEFLSKLKDFEQQVLNDAVKNSELWWGESMSLELCKHTFFPFLKYSKNKDTKKIDYTKPPTIRAKVPNYDGKWGVEIYDTSSKLIFPSENDHLTPMDFVPKLSRVACGLQCTGIWIGGKGWGLTWKMFQCIVKPREVVSVFGKCHISLSTEEKTALESQVIHDEATAEEMGVVPPIVVKSAMDPVANPDTHVEDSDGEGEEAADASRPDEPAEAPSSTMIKKVVKKEPAAAAVEDAEAPKKKVIRKVVAAK
jgi:hypothetical protein